MIPEPVYTVLSENPDLARLDEMYLFATPVKGFDVEMLYPEKRCRLHTDGTLVCYPGLQWDFGSGSIGNVDLTIDNKPMRTASLAHDALCWMTDQGRLPWKCRRKADNYFGRLLYKCGSLLIRSFWCWRAVRIYSKTVAKKNAQPYEGRSM